MKIKDTVKIKEQARKLAVGFEVVDETDEVSSKHTVLRLGMKLTKSVTIYTARRR
ncbi:chlorohydrolase [Streptococcus pneumoniae]|nr:chlorohydrolase [Streptococcus pneumoniae]